MISWIKGEIVNSWKINNKFYILINCQGLGYEIQTLESIFIDIKSKKISKEEIILWIKHIKKEDSDMLFGFISKEQRDFFIQILNIKGIGSQISMSLLNKFSLKQLFNAVINNDKKSISSVQGVGQKMTDRIILELKSKVDMKQIENLNSDNKEFTFDNNELNSIFEDINLTLQSLNYPKREIKSLIPKLTDDIKNNKNLPLAKDSFSFEILLKEAINYLEKKNN